MTTKGFQLEVELDLQAVTCPGVCLCSNGKISLQVYMLDTCIQTDNVKPVFPIICGERYLFSKVFPQENRLNDLQRRLSDEWIYIELIQWQNCDRGYVLASFQTTLDDLLFPPSFRGCIAGVDLELLMEPTKLFPGTIAPKIEVATKTTITEIFCNFETKSSNFINPKLILSTGMSQRKCPKTRKVCHSISSNNKARSGTRLSKRPPFLYRRVEDDLIARKVTGFAPELCPSNSLSRLKRRCKVKNSTCFCCNKTKSLENLSSDIESTFSRVCNCIFNKSGADVHKNIKCSICSKYDSYFSRENINNNNNNIISRPIKSHSNAKHATSTNEVKFHIRRPKSPCESDFADTEDNLCQKCICSTKDRVTALAQQLHRKLVESLHTNSKILNSSCLKYPDCI